LSGIPHGYYCFRRPPQTSSFRCDAATAPFPTCTAKPETETLPDEARVENRERTCNWYGKQCAAQGATGVGNRDSMIEVPPAQPRLPCLACLYIGRQSPRANEQPHGPWDDEKAKSSALSALELFFILAEISMVQSSGSVQWADL
jgi:hypothetical protein